MVEGYDGAGDRVLGEAGGQVGAQFLRGRLRHGVSDQPFAPDGHHRLRHPGMPREGRLDLGRFDAEAAEFELGVGTAVELQLVGVGHADPVAGAVHAGADGAVGVGDEAFGGRPGAAEVAAGDPVPGEVQLPDDSPGYGP
ncbi:hypothetical protein Saa2_06396 [Streptomyces acidiscabies]|nr:hypothetical protein Saa2_06396 [Streptomyces acidiscabies]